MLILILHNEVPPNAAPDQRDVLVQLAAVDAALGELGHVTRTLACTLNLEALKNELLVARPDVVFNLVESLGGSDQLMWLVPALLDSLRIPYTGATTRNIARTSDKVSAKRDMRQAGIPTPNFWSPSCGKIVDATGRRFILKAVAEHASVGMDSQSIVSARDARELAAACASWQQRTGIQCFAEQFIAGREFNLSLLDGPSGVELLPPAEIDFSTFPADAPRIVDYRAKWDEGSFEYQHTPRRFEFSDADLPLLKQLAELARRCWEQFDLHGYARVDFRVDEQGQPWVLEINANPCLSPDAGFAAALERARIDYKTAIQRILLATG